MLPKQTNLKTKSSQVFYMLTLVWRNTFTLEGGDVIWFKPAVYWVILPCSNLLKRNKKYLITLQ